MYRVADSGPDHAKVFHAEVTVRGRSLGKGAGRSKKQAEQVAARYAWFTLNAGPGPSAAGTEPLGTGPAGTGPVGTGPAGTEPLGTGPAGTEPAGTEPAEASPSAAG